MVLALNDLRIQLLVGDVFWAPAKFSEPCVTTIVCPSSPFSSVTEEAAETSQRGDATYVAMEKDTCFCRSAVLVVLPHSISIVPF